jgi:hypothetical protein
LEEKQSDEVEIKQSPAAIASNDAESGIWQQILTYVKPLQNFLCFCKPFIPATKPCYQRTFKIEPYSNITYRLAFTEKDRALIHLAHHMQKKLDMEAAESSESQDLADSIESEGKGNDHSTGTIQGKPFFLNVKVTIMAKKYAVREGNTH